MPTPADDTSVGFRDHDTLPWRPAPGFEGQGHEKVLHHDPDNGVTVRLLRCDAGFEGTAVLRHDDVEEFAWVLDGEAVNTRTGERYSKDMFCHVPQGVEHGPFRSDGGVWMLEVRYAPSGAGARTGTSGE